MQITDRHDRAMEDGASWYCWIYTQIMRERGRGRSQALYAALKRHPRAWAYIDRRLCDTLALMSLRANAAVLSKAENAVQAARTAAGSSSSTGGKRANP